MVLDTDPEDTFLVEVAVERTLEIPLEGLVCLGSLVTFGCY